MSSRASRGMGMGMEKTGLGVDLLEELLARHRRREHAEGPLRGATVALGGRRRAAIRERNDVGKIQSELDNGATRRGGRSRGDVLESEDSAARSTCPF